MSLQLRASKRNINNWTLVVVSTFAFMVAPFYGVIAHKVANAAETSNTTTYGFDEYTGSNTWGSHANWAFHGTDAYTSDDSCGVKANCIALNTDGSYADVTLPDGKTPTSVKFYVKPMSDSLNGKLLVEEEAPGQATTTHTFTAADITEGVHTITNLKSTTRSLRFSYAKTTGNVALDDVAVTTEDSDSNTVNISTVQQLCDAIDNQADGQVWNIEAGNYGLTQCNTIEAGGQTGWYFPVIANNLTINGNGATIYGEGFTKNGALHTQDFMAIYGDNVTLNNVILMPKVEPNKTIEVYGDSATIKNVTIKPNTLVDQSEYDNTMGNSTPTKTEAKQWGGSIYYNGAGGTQTLENVTIDNGGVSIHAPSTTFNISNVDITIASGIDWINDYAFYVATPSATINGIPTTTWHVSDAFDNLDDVIAGVNDSTLIGAKRVVFDSNITSSSQNTITQPVVLDGQGHSVTTSGSDYAFLLKGDGTTVKNMHVVKADKTSQNIVGIQAKDVTIDTVDFSGHYASGDNDVSRAIEVSGDNFTIKNSSFKNLRQPAYINAFTGMVSDNYTGGTKGWVVTQDSNVAFTGNTWGSNVTDIAIIQNNNTSPNHYTCQVTAQIRADNHNASVDNQVQTCDLTGPTITINTGSPKNGDYLSGVRWTREGQADQQRNRFVFDITDPSGIQKGYINLHNMDTKQKYHYHLTQHVAPHQSQWYADVDTTKLPDGVYQVEVRAVDNAGNPRYFNNRLESYSVTIDNTAPVIRINNQTPESMYKLSDSINVHIVEAHRDHTDVDRTDVQAPTNDKHWSYAGEWFGLSWLKDGQYKLTAYDKAGNKAVVSFTTDRTKPRVDTNSTSASDPDYNPTNFTIHATDDTKNGWFNTGIAKVAGNIYKYDAAQGKYILFQGHSSITANPFTVGLDNLADGVYYVRYNAKDGAGNISNTEQYYFVVDTTKPTIRNVKAVVNPGTPESKTYSLVGKNTSLVVKSGDTVTVTIEVSGTGSEVDWARVRAYEQNVAAGNWHTYLFQDQAMTDNGDGTYSYTFTVPSEYTPVPDDTDHTINESRYKNALDFNVRDIAGNTRGTELYFTINNPPVIGAVNINPSPATVGDKITLRGTISGLQGGSAKLVIDGKKSKTLSLSVDSSGNWSQTINPLPAGDYTYYIVAEDAMGTVVSSDQSDFSVSTPHSQSDAVASHKTHKVAVNSTTTTLRGDGASTTTATIAGGDSQTVSVDQGTTKVSDEHNTADKVDSVSNGQAVKGASDTKGDANASPAQKVFGLIWYWWLLVLAVIIALWWLVAAARRRKRDDN